MNSKIFHYLFFAVLFGYVVCVVQFGLTTVFVQDEDFQTRLQGSYLAYLDLWGSNSLEEFISKSKRFFEVSMISGYGASHGPLHYFIWNFFFSVLIKDSLPLTSQTIFIPNIVATWVLLIYSYLLGRQFFSKKFSYLFAAAVILSPWAAIAMRFPTFHALLTTLMHIATLYHYTVFIKEPDRPLNRFLAPFSLAIYLMAGLDWPFFLFIIVLYLAIS